MKILVVEDDATQRLFLKTFLGKYGTCETAETGKEAIILFVRALKEKRPYHLVCLDILLPEISGKDVLKEFRSLEKKENIPFHERSRILMVTALADLKHVTEAFASDCDGYLVKPIDPAKLKEKLVSLGLLKE
ncbi:MAG: response regulator [Spirochaetes bacterium]|nr:response regulator [Spirochaetota bacterium]